MTNDKKKKIDFSTSALITFVAIFREDKLKQYSNVAL